MKTKKFELLKKSISDNLTDEQKGELSILLYNETGLFQMHEIEETILKAIIDTCDEFMHQNNGICWEMKNACKIILENHKTELKFN